MALTIAELKAIAGLDTKPFESGAGRVETRTKTMAQRMNAMVGGQLKQLAGMIGAAFAVRAVIRFGAAQMQAADRTMDLATALGLTAEQFQALEQSAEQFGGTTENVQKAMMQLRRVQGDVIGGNKEYAQSFKVLGISQRDLETSTLPQLLELVAKGYKAAGGSAEAYNAASELMGRGGKELTGVLMDLANNGLQSTIDKGIEAGTVLRNHVTKELAAANNELERGKRIWDNFWTTAMAGAIKFVRIQREVHRLSKETSRWEVLPTLAVLEQMAEANLYAVPLAERQKKLATGAAGGTDADADRVAARMNSLRVSAPQAADRLAKIGGIIGGQTSKDSGLFERQIKELEMIRKATEATAESSQASTAAIIEMKDE